LVWFPAAIAVAAFSPLLAIVARSIVPGPPLAVTSPVNCLHFFKVPGNRKFLNDRSNLFLPGVFNNLLLPHFLSCGPGHGD
jgi:hypothetical protein